MEKTVMLPEIMAFYEYHLYAYDSQVHVALDLRNHDNIATSIIVGALDKISN